MARTKTAPVSNLNQILTIGIYIALVGIFITYVMPIVSVQIPALGQKTFSVRDMVASIPKGAPQKNERPSKLSSDYNFLDLVKEVAPRDPQTKAVVKVSPQFIMGAMVPVALAMVYVLALVSLFLAPLRNSMFVLFTTGVATIMSVYVLAGTHYLSSWVERAFSESVSKLSDTPFAAVTQQFVQQVSIKPDSGIYVLLIVTLLAFILAWYRKMKSFQY